MRRLDGACVRQMAEAFSASDPSSAARHGLELNLPAVSATDTFLPALMKQAAVQPGERVLLLGAGPGPLLAACANRVGREGELLVIEQSHAAREEAERSLAAFDLAADGLPSLRFLPVTPADARLQASYWDVAVCHFGLPLYSDPTAVLVMILRALRPVGRAAFSVWATPERVRWAGFLLDALERQQQRPRLPASFAFAEPGRLSYLLAESGFQDVTPERVREDLILDGFEQYWRLLLNSELAPALVPLSDEARMAARAALQRIVRPYTRRDGRLALPMEALALAAAK